MDVQNDYYNAFYYRIQDIKNTRYPHVTLDLALPFIYMLKISWVFQFRFFYQKL